MEECVKLYKWREIFAVALNCILIGDAGDDRQVTANNIAQLQAGNVSSFSAVKVFDSIAQSPPNKARQRGQCAIYPCEKILLLSQFNEINRRILVYMDSCFWLVPCIGVVRNVNATARIGQRRCWGLASAVVLRPSASPCEAFCNQPMFTSSVFTE